MKHAEVGKLTSITYATNVAFIRLNSRESGNCRKCLSEINTKILRMITRENVH